MNRAASAPPLPSLPPLASDARTVLTLLDQALTSARIRFELPAGPATVGRNVESPHATEPDLVVRVTDPAFFARLVSDGSLGLAETFMDGGWSLERGALEDFFYALLTSELREVLHRSPGIAFRLALLRLRHRLMSPARHIRAHYDLGDDLYAVFLDETRGYTCGYQRDPRDDSRTLQENKYDRICQKLRLERGHSLFDLGCGFGGLLIFAAQNYGARCTGITNSPTHATFANERARKLGIADRVAVQVGDYREAKGTYDRVASVGMFEHIFPRDRSAYFHTFRRLLAPGGIGLLHAIGAASAPAAPDPFVQKYIFPGSTLSPLSTFIGGFERVALPVLDVENLARHYHPTSVAWLDAWRRHQSRLDPARYDARFRRMWETYLAGCVAATRYADGALWQVVVTNDYRRHLPFYRVN